MFVGDIHEHVPKPRFQPDWFSRRDACSVLMRLYDGVSSTDAHACGPRVIVYTLCTVVCVPRDKNML